MATAAPPPPQVTLRHATTDDKPAMLAVMSPHKNGFFPGGLRSNNVWIAEINGVIVGFVGWKEDRVLALYVNDAWRGQRIVGSALLTAAENEIRAAGHRLVRVMIDADADPAHRFYQRAGYATDPVEWDADVAWMTKRLT